LGKDPRTLRKIVVMNPSYVPPKILRNLPYEYRIPINDLDDIELMTDFHDNWGFGGSKGTHNNISVERDDEGRKFETIGIPKTGITHRQKQSIGLFLMTQHKEIVMNTVSLSEVETPTTVEEFRENLSRFFLKDGGTNNLMVMGNDSIPIDEISSLADVYTKTGTGFGGNGGSPSITPSLDFSMDTVKEFMDKTGQIFSCVGFFEDEDNFDLYDASEDQTEYVTSSNNVGWYTLDNQILRGFYSKVLGEFSGYVPVGDSA
jgi:hypothetical protein